MSLAEPQSRTAGVPAAGTVLIRYVHLDGSDRSLACLSQEERDRASRLRIPAVRRRFEQSRVFVRTVLGRHLGLSPDAVRFATEADGKPRISNAGVPISCNWSHSGGWAALAIAEGGRVGIDLECSREVDGAQHLAGYTLPAAELQCWRALPENLRSEALLQAWVRREAIAKADGRGIRIGLASVRLDADPPGVARLDDGTVFHWRDWEGPGGLIGAVASDRPIGHLDVRAWDGASMETMAAL